ncbi:unnamed protein product [Linum trigynum]|uniref:Uncharacterized protein n=1 Tax=Linum trigynum TaxID=586398 RepID=A0AAV2FUR1_9ROSI
MRKSLVARVIGGPRRLQRPSPARGSSRLTKPDSKTMGMKAHHREEESPHFSTQVAPANTSEMQAVLEQSRRRRVILDDDSDDDDPIPGHAESSLANGNLKGSMTQMQEDRPGKDAADHPTCREEAETQLNEKPGDSSRRPIRGLEPQQPPKQKSIQRKGRLTLGGPPMVAKVYKMKAHGVGGKNMPAGSSSPDKEPRPVLSKGGEEGNNGTLNEKHDLEDSDSDEEAHCFEIKKRAHLKAEKMSPQVPPPPPPPPTVSAKLWQLLKLACL